MSDQKIYDADGLDRVLCTALLQRDPSLSMDDAMRLARIDRQLMQTLDVLIGNRDRHGDNALFDAKTGVLTLIDHGLSMDGMHPHALSKPFAAFMGDAHETVHVSGGGRLTSVPLDPEVVARIAETDRTAISAAFDTLWADTRGRTDVGRNAHPVAANALDGLFARMDDIVATKALRFLS